MPRRPEPAPSPPLDGNQIVPRPDAGGRAQAVVGSEGGVAPMLNPEETDVDDDTRPSDATTRHRPRGSDGP